MGNVRSEKITFIGADGTSRLAARLDMPAGRARAFALFAHCFTCTHNVLAATRISAFASSFSKTSRRTS